MSKDTHAESYCNISRALSVVGDRWTLLIMREISMGVRRFEEIQAQTGMSSHLLATRLKRLEQDKIVERRVYSARPLRHEYHATPRGRDLDGVSLALRNWDLRWGGSDGKGAAAVVLTDKRTGTPVDGTWQNPTGEAFTFANTTSAISRAWKSEREARAAAFYLAKKRMPPGKAKAVPKAAPKKSTIGKRTVVKPAAVKKTRTKTK